jgi:hypothetical protein
MTPGRTEDTGDGGARDQGAKRSEASRDERWPWPPAQRLLRDKPAGGKRPLGLPGWSEHAGQDLVRARLEAADAPPGSTHRHGGRPPRGGPTARPEVGATWTGPQGCLAGDRQGGGDPSAQAIRMPLLRAHLHAHRCLQWIAGALQAGDGAAWTSHPSRSGSPQGGIGSPRLSNLSLDR